MDPEEFGTGGPPPMSSGTPRTGPPPRKATGSRSHSPRSEVNDGALVRSSASRDVATIPVGKGSVGTQPSLSQHGSFFQSSRNVSINGGEFNSSRLHHTNLTINFNHSGSEDSVEVERSVQETALKTSPQELDRYPDNRHLRADPGPSDGMQEGNATNNLFHQAPLPVQKSSDLYYRHLATKGRGSPLWIPEPNRNLPIEYQRKGISIGDVGILTDDGSFDFLFNICLPQGDPINPEEMPEDFQPLKAPRARDIRNHLEFKPSSYLASASVKSSQRDRDSGLTFESSASEGAILTMPHGSLSRDLTNKTTFKKYAFANVVKWYRYANEVCGREAKNGDVRLVVGISPATAWGMATFANLSEQSGFLLRFKPVEEHSLGPPYGWEYSGTAEVKSGPHTEEIDTLRKMDREAGYEGSDEYENQTLFVRTINVTIQDNIWSKLSAGWEELYLDDGFNDSATDKGDHSFDTPNPPSNSTGGGPGLENRGMASDNNPHDSSLNFKQHKRFQSVYLSESPSAMTSHPSNLINRLLLEIKPNACFAVTDDDDWIAAIRESDKVLPPPEILFSRIMETHEICEEEGIVYFQPKVHVANRTSDVGIRQLNTILESSYLDFGVESWSIGNDFGNQQTPWDSAHLAVPSDFLVPHISKDYIDDGTLLGDTTENEKMEGVVQSDFPGQYADKDSVDGETLHGNLTENEKIENKRRQNAIAARMSRRRRLDQLRQLEDEVARLGREKEIWKERALVFQRLLSSHGLPSPNFET